MAGDAAAVQTAAAAPSALLVPDIALMLPLSPPSIDGNQNFLDVPVEAMTDVLLQVM
jgi:hypothetical protein